MTFLRSYKITRKYACVLECGDRGSEGKGVYSRSLDAGANEETDGVITLISE